MTDKSTGRGQLTAAAADRLARQLSADRIGVRTHGTTVSLFCVRTGKTVTLLPYQMTEPGVAAAVAEFQAWIDREHGGSV